MKIEKVSFEFSFKSCLWLGFPEWKREIVPQPMATIAESIVTSCKAPVSKWYR